MLSHLRRAELRLSQAEIIIRRIGAHHNYTLEYLAEQWNRQRKTQMDAISTTAKRKKERMIELLDMEERLVEARYVVFL